MNPTFLKLDAGGSLERRNRLPRPHISEPSQVAGRRWLRATARGEIGLAQGFAVYPRPKFTVRSGEVTQAEGTQERLRHEKSQ
jgi:hypothetical protein